MTRLAWTGLSRGDAEHRLTAWPTIAVDAAASATAGDTAAQAVRLLEDGRAVLWSRHLRMRPQTGLLRAVRPDLADRVDGIAARLRHPAPSP
ncbi:hypothetical protein [Actinoplanes xinjiangensis]|uniref:hypothetical protein n=1 Tax=Actinoplanes xinjiangensis TaxID=512350 RepID=UPI003422F602